MHKILTVLILLTAATYGQGSSVDTVYDKPVMVENHGPCSYVNYFYVPTDYIDSIIADKTHITDTIPGWEYFNSDKVKDQIKLQLGECLHSGRLREIVTPGQYALLMKRLNLVSTFIFHDSSGDDFYLLEYQPDFGLRSDHPSPTFLAGCAKYSDSIVILEELKSGMLKDNFNNLIDNNSLLREMDPLCKSAILLRIVYRRWITFPESYNELAYVYNMNLEIGYSIPWDVISPYDLFIFNITDTYKTLNENGYLKENMSYFDNPDFGAESDIPIKLHAPVIKYGESEDSVSAIIFCPRNYELAKWLVVFDKDGSLKSINYNSNPYHFYENLEDRSPYNYYGNDFRGDN